MGMAWGGYLGVYDGHNNVRQKSGDTTMKRHNAYDIVCDTTTWQLRLCWLWHDPPAIVQSVSIRFIIFAAFFP